MPVRNVSGDILRVVARHVRARTTQHIELNGTVSMRSSTRDIAMSCFPAINMMIA